MRLIWFNWESPCDQAEYDFVILIQNEEILFLFERILTWSLVFNSKIT